MALKEQLPKTIELFAKKDEMDVSSFEESIHEFSKFIGQMKESLTSGSEEDYNKYQETIAQLQDIIDARLSEHCAELGVPMKDLYSFLNNEDNYGNKEEYAMVQSIKNMFETETGASIDAIIQDRAQKKTKKSKTWIRS